MTEDDEGEPMDVGMMFFVATTLIGFLIVGLSLFTLTKLWIMGTLLGAQTLCFTMGVVKSWKHLPGVKDPYE